MNVPSGYTALDLIGFTDRGDYVSTDNYVKNDLVHYNGRVWKCLIDDTTGITPVEGANWTVWIDEAAYLSGLADVTITNPANGQVIRYNSQSGKWENVGVDSTPTSGSANLVQSGGVATQLANKANSADLATVATSGDYQDLNNLPTLADVATTGQYSDLLGLPTIPTVNNGTLTLQINGVTVETFNANDSNNKTANFNVPTKTSDLTNDSNFVSDANYQHITVDSAFSDTSTNPVQNKVVNSLKETLTYEVNENGVKNILDAKDSITLVTTNTSAIKVGSVDLVAGQKIVYSALQETAMASNTRNTLRIETADGSQNWNESGAVSNYHLEAGVHEMKFTAPADGTYSIKVWGHTISADTKYSKFMVCDADIYAMNDTYEPYAKTNQQLTKETTELIDNQNVNGAVNMLPNNATTQVVNGVTFTVNPDGSITASGTATAKATFPICSKNNHVFPDSILGKSVKISGSINTNNAYVQLYDPSANTGRKDTVFTMPSNVNSLLWNVIIEVTSGTTVNGTFYPMITVPSYSGDYVPYAKSNKELTEDVAVKLGGKPTANTTYIDTADLHYEQFGKVTHVFGNFTTKTAIASSDALVQLFSNLPKSNGGMSSTSSAYTLCLLHDNTNDGLAYRCFVSTNGALVSRHKAIPVGTYFADFTYISA